MERCEEFNTKEQKMKRELFDLKCDLEMKDNELVMILKLNEELKNKLVEEEQVIGDLTQENEVGYVLYHRLSI